MKKFIALGILVAVVVGLIASGTWAVFTDTETTTDNMFTAGTIDISLDPDTGQDVATAEGALDLKPSQTGWIDICVTNEGTNPAEIWKHIGNVVNDENGIVEPEQEYYNENPGSDQLLLSDYIHYDMYLCEYDDTEVCYDETDFALLSGHDPYEFDVCRSIEGGKAKWTLDIDEASTPSLSHSAVQLVISQDGVTPDFLIGVNNNFQPLYRPYNGSWGAETDVLPDGMSVVGTIADRHFEIEIPLCVLDCECYYWAMNVEADFAGSGGSNQYRYTTDWGWSAITYEQVCCVSEVLIHEEDGFFLTGGEFGVMSYWVWLGILEPGEKMLVSQSYHLDTEVDNWGQSDKVTFDIDFVAQQIEGAIPPPPGPELPGHERPSP